MGKSSTTEVAAQGVSERHIQFPSPVYFSEWISDTHVLIGAGGGGHRFGMANVAVLLRVEPPRRLDAHRRFPPQDREKQQQPQQDGHSSYASPPVVWGVETAVDLQDRVPWCVSSFLPAPSLERKQHRVAAAAATAAGVGGSHSGGVQEEPTAFGFVAISHMDSVSLLRVVGQSNVPCSPMGSPRASSFGLEVLRVLPVAFDENNPDKKPISMLTLDRHSGSLNDEHDDAVILVAGQDDGTIGIFVVAVRSSSSSSNTKDETATGEAIQSTAAWNVGCRTNDVVLVEDVGSPSSFTVVAALQDKTIRVAVVTLTTTTTSSSLSSLTVKETGRFDGDACRIPFKLMKGSLKFLRRIHAFDTSNKVESNGAAEDRSHGSAILIVAYDSMSGWTYVNVAMLHHETGKVTFPHSAVQVVADGATCITQLHDSRPTSTTLERILDSTTPREEAGEASAQQRSEQQQQPNTTTKWIMGTVEGSIVELQLELAAHLAAPEESKSASSPARKRQPTDGCAGRVLVTRRRPSGNPRRKGSSKVRDATHNYDIDPLHQEPITSITVSPSGKTAISSDLAQTVVLSTWQDYHQEVDSADQTKANGAAAAAATRSQAPPWAIFGTPLHKHRRFLQPYPDAMRRMLSLIRWTTVLVCIVAGLLWVLTVSELV